MDLHANIDVRTLKGPGMTASSNTRFCCHPTDNNSPAYIHLFSGGRRDEAVAKLVYLACRNVRLRVASASITR